jgi:hypothetical protein
LPSDPSVGRPLAVATLVPRPSWREVSTAMTVWSPGGGLGGRAPVFGSVWQQCSPGPRPHVKAAAAPAIAAVLAGPLSSPRRLGGWVAAGQLGSRPLAPPPHLPVIIFTSTP